MLVDDKTKLKVIFTIDNLKKNFVGTIYASELRGLRRKYVYKDIFLSDLKKDVDWLNDLRKIKKI